MDEIHQRIQALVYSRDEYITAAQQEIFRLYATNYRTDDMSAKRLEEELIDTTARINQRIMEEAKQLVRKR